MGGRRSTPPRRRHARSPRRSLGGELVRDPNCGTYVAKASAITVGSGDNTKYYCSVKCRDEHERR
jgi:hypothetical protein